MRGERILLAICTILAFVLARPYAGSWNDACRLATAESLVDRGTLAIDDSIFVVVPQSIDHLPYPVDRDDLLKHGTRDKLFIHGSYYSDKTPLPSLYLAGIYKLWRIGGGPSAFERVDWYCRVLTWSSSGLAFVLAVAGVLALGRIVGLSARWRLLLASSFAISTILPGYVGTVNAHIIQLAAAVWLFVCLLRLSTTDHPVRWLLAIGLLLGLAYSADASAGPTLCICTTIGVLVMTRQPMSAVILIFASSPFVIGHHVVNYAIGGTITPANANPEYFQWEGSPFQSGNITGRWRHGTVNHFITYIGDLLFGKQGFLFHNGPALLASIWSIPLFLRTKRERAVLGIGLAWCLTTVLLASASSTNRSGQCLSVRWFLPLLSVAFLNLAILIRNRPDLRPDFLAVSAWGLIIGMLSTIYGLWIPHLIPGYWLIVAGMISTMMIVRYQMRVKPNLVSESTTTWHWMRTAIRNVIG